MRLHRVPLAQIQRTFPPDRLAAYLACARVVDGVVEIDQDGECYRAMFAGRGVGTARRERGPLPPPADLSGYDPETSPESPNRRGCCDRATAPQD